MNSQVDYYEDEVSFRDVFLTLWRGKFWLLGFSVLAGFISILTVLRLPNVYTAEVVLSPANDAKQNGVSNLAGRFGGLANLAGIDIGGSTVDIATIGIETLQSRAFLIDFIKRHELLIPLMGAKGWDLESQNWIIDPEKYNKVTNEWMRDVSLVGHSTPSEWEAFKVFSRSITINQDKKTQIVSLTVQSISPLYAKIWSEQLVNDLNDYLRKRDIEQAKKSIEFLEKQLSSTSVSQMHAILYQLIEDQTKTIMLASVRDGYAFQVVDPPIIPEEKSGPKRGIVVVVSVLASLLVCAFFLVIFVGGKKRSNEK